MPRAYSARLVALTIHAPLKWVDNLLSHYDLPGVSRSRQGVQRSVSDDGLLAIEITRALAAELALPLARAVEVARHVIESRGAPDAQFITPSGIALSLPIADIERRLRERMVEAIEAVALIPRGRPPRVGRDAE